MNQKVVQSISLLKRNAGLALLTGVLALLMLTTASCNEDSNTDDGGEDSGDISNTDGGTEGSDTETETETETDVASLPKQFQWTSTGPLISPIQDESHPILSVKDPSVVFFEDRWHVFATTADTDGEWSLVYTSFSEWSEASDAPLYYLDTNPELEGYHAAPQVFYFSPHKKWYMIFQSGQPQYSTTDDLTKPESWSRPTDFFADEPAIVTENKGSGTWLDFWMICDSSHCHLFFTDDNGHLYRSDTHIDDFPEGFGDPVIAIEGTKETVFEGSATYHVKGTDSYLTLVEAFGTVGERYYRSFVSDTLDGEWEPLAATPEKPFAGRANVSFEDGEAWTLDISHGELLRDGYDESLTIDPSNLRFLYQGVDPSETGVEYYQLPYRLALLTYTEEPVDNSDDPLDVEPACEGTTVAGKAQISDFEDGSISGWWDSYDDSSAGTHDPLTVEEGGANDTAYALHFSGTGYTSWGANLGNSMGCTDVSSFDGISFYAKGTSSTDDSMNVVAQVAAAQPVGSGGECLENCYSHPRASFTLTPEWTHYRVPFTDLEHPGWGVDASYEGVVLGFAFESSGPDFDVWFDEITLYSESLLDGGTGDEVDASAND